VTYQDVFPSILTRSVGNLTGFGEMPSSAAAKPASRARLSDDNLNSILRMNVTQLEPNIKKISF
jgi:hypothetical protein